MPKQVDAKPFISNDYYRKETVLKQDDSNINRLVKARQKE